MTLRRIIQSVAALYIVLIGVRFVIYLNALNEGNMDASKPGGVEGFLPISALLGVKQLVFTGAYDVVHPAGLTIFLAIVLMSLLLKKSFCSHICPVGLASELVSNRGKKVRIPLYIPIWALKYILLGFFVYIVFIGMDLASVQAFIRSPYNIVSDYKMLKLFAPPSQTTVLVIAVLIVLTLIFKGFWCKYLCPYGALVGLVSLLSPVKVRRDADKCINCHRCAAVCPAALKVYEKKTVHNPDCNGCHDCINECPVAECLTSRIVKHSRYFAVLPVVLFLGVIGVAMAAGLWDSAVPNEMYKYFMGIGISHP